MQWGNQNKTWRDHTGNTLAIQPCITHSACKWNNGIRFFFWVNSTQANTVDIFTVRCGRSCNRSPSVKSATKKAMECILLPKLFNLFSCLYGYEKKPKTLLTLSRRHHHHHHHHVAYSPEAVATARHEVRPRERFKASEAGRLRSVETWRSQLRRLPRERIVSTSY